MKFVKNIFKNTNQVVLYRINIIYPYVLKPVMVLAFFTQIYSFKNTTKVLSQFKNN